MKRIPRVIALFFLGVVLGLPLGAYLVQHKFINKEKAIAMTSEEAIADDYAKKEFFYAGPQDARDALTYAVKLHKEMRVTSPLWGWPEKMDLGWCYAELSLTEESAGNTDLSREYMSLAQQTLKELGAKDTSESRIRELLEHRVISNPPSSGESK
jgi:hypothetical protein